MQIIGRCESCTSPLEVTIIDFQDFFNPEVDLKRFTNFGGEGVTLIMCQRHEVVV